MPSYVIDTDVVSDILLQRHSQAHALFKSLQTNEANLLFISEITHTELLSIPTLKEDDIKSIEELLECFDDVVMVDGEISRLAGELRRSANSAKVIDSCEKCRRRFGGKLKTPDALIAATAISEGAILITRNTKDFQFVVNNFELLIHPLKSLEGSKEAISDFGSSQERGD